MSASEAASVLPSAIRRLSATGPFPPDEEHLMLYGRLVGAWDVDWVALDADGTELARRRGEWHFAWVLGGRGIQDVIWTAGEPAHGDGTTLRCWDRGLGAWRVVFMSPGDGQFVTLIGRRQGDRIVQDVLDPPQDGTGARWIFSDITATHFVWRAERSDDRGRTWTVTHEMRASRQAR